MSSADEFVISSTVPLKIGFLGLGNMGSRIVNALLQTGHDVTVWNRTPSKVIIGNIMAVFFNQGSAVVGPKCICGQGSAPNPAGELTVLPTLPNWWGEGSLPPPQEPFPALGLEFQPFGPHESPQKKTWVP